MKANELRIGNYVKYILTDGNPEDKQITGIFHDLDGFKGYAVQFGIGNCTLVDSDCIELIPITEEWLLKFGFEYRNDWRGNGAILDLKGKDYRSASVAFSHEQGRFIYLSAWHSPLQYVHQLQNLYFALTSVELEILVPA